MAIAHLLRLKSAPHINRLGAVRTRMLCSSLPSDGNSEKEPHPKKSELVKQRKTEAVESFVKKYMKENQGVFPKPSYVHTEVGGSWYNLKEMLQFVKEKLTGKINEQNPPSDPDVSSYIISRKVDDNVKHDCNTMQKLEQHMEHSQQVRRLVRDLQNTETSREETTQKMESEDTLSMINSIIKDEEVSHFPAEDRSSSSRTNMDKLSLLPDKADEMYRPSSPSFFEQSSEASMDTAGGSSDIDGLIGCIKALPQLSADKPQETKISDKSYHSDNSIITSITGTQHSSNMPKHDKNEGNVSPFHRLSMIVKNDIFKKQPRYLINEDQEKSSASFDSNRSHNETKSKKESGQHKVLVRFVPKMAEHRDITHVFNDSGDVSKVVASCSEGAFFSAAYIYFRSDEGMKKALEKTDVSVRGYTVTVEPAYSSKDMTRARVPDLISHPDVPIELVKNPKNTAMISGTAWDNIRFHHIEDALSFCNSKISHVFFGSSSTSAFVEFETEEGKENALARHWIDVLGRRFTILRVDAPRTTVVRISNLAHLGSKKEVTPLFKSFGNIKTQEWRSGDTVDVQFKIGEWPNMVTILNRLNGSEIDGKRLVAKPAPVYPADVLDALWNHPEGREHLRSTFHNLLRNISGSPVGVGTGEIIDSVFEDRVGS